MCGIAGILSLQSEPPSLEQLGAMAASLSHRGPDEFGVYRDANAGLAHARLSIIDLSGGHQPISNGEGTLWVGTSGNGLNALRQSADGKNVVKNYTVNNGLLSDVILALAAAPSGDLWVGQTDEDELGFAYADVDRLLEVELDALDGALREDGPLPGVDPDLAAELDAPVEGVDALHDDAVGSLAPQPVRDGTAGLIARIASSGR